jgi:hypothetical protein
MPPMGLGVKPLDIVAFPGPAHYGAVAGVSPTFFLACIAAMELEEVVLGYNGGANVPIPNT